MNSIPINCIIFIISIFYCCLVSSAPDDEREEGIIQINSNFTNNDGEKLEQDCNVPLDLSRAGIAGSRYRWRRAQVPYKIDRKFPRDQFKNIKSAMAKISKVTCVTFKKRTHEKNYVYYNYGGTGCNGKVGMQGGKQIINLKPGDPGYYDCAQRVHTVIHETMHALGFHHEMARPDRDEYVKIVYENIKHGQEHNFIIPSHKQVDFDVPFDYQSIMMYKWNSFAKDPRKPTIIAKKPGIGKNFRGETMSKNDIASINGMYKCKK